MFSRKKVLDIIGRKISKYRKQIYEGNTKYTNRETLARINELENLRRELNNE